MMGEYAVKQKLDERREQYNAISATTALESPVDTERFYKFLGKISGTQFYDDGEVEVRFKEPVPGETTLNGSYTYRVNVADETVRNVRDRAEMPRQDLVALQQVAIVIWAMANGRI